MFKDLSAKLQNEIVVICIITILLIPVVVFCPSNVPRIIFGLPFVLFFPGYTLTAALFSRRGGLSLLERLTFSIMLSLAIVPLIGFILNYIWEISLYTKLFFIALFILVTSAIALRRRWGLPKDERFGLPFHLPSTSWLGQGSVDKFLSLFLIIAILGGIGAASYTYIKNRQDYTEFYIVTTEGKAVSYPQKLQVGEEGKVILGIENQEGRDVTYRVEINGPAEVSVGGVEQREINLTLADGESWEQKVSFSFDSRRDNQKVEFVLYEDGELYFQYPLHLWIDVVP